MLEGESIVELLGFLLLVNDAFRLMQCSQGNQGAR